MDWLPGGLEKLFADYDRIVSHHGAHDAPTNVQETPKPDQPPSQPIETPAAPPNDLFARTEAGDQRLNAKEKQQEDQKHKEQKQRDGFDPWIRQDNADQQLQHKIDNPNGASFQEDEQGLVNAYNDKTSTGVFYDPDTRTEYVKGSVTKRDWLDDFTKVPFWATHAIPSATRRRNPHTTTCKPLDAQSIALRVIVWAAASLYNCKRTRLSPRVEPSAPLCSISQVLEVRDIDTRLIL